MKNSTFVLWYALKVLNQNSFWRVIQVMKTVPQQMIRYKYISPFFVGFASIFDIFGTMLRPTFPPTKTPEQYDAEAMRADWQSVGNDIYIALNEFEMTLPHDKRNKSSQTTEEARTSEQPTLFESVESYN